MRAEPSGAVAGEADASGPRSAQATPDRRRPGAKARSSNRTEDVLNRFHEEAQLGEAYDARMLIRLWPFVRPQWKHLAVSLGLLIVTALLALLRPLIMRDALDAFDAPGGMDRLTRNGFLLTGIMLAEQSLAFPQLYLMQLAGARAMADLRMRVFGFLHTRRLGFFDRTPVGRLVTRVTNDVDAIGEMFASGALNAFGDLIRLAVIVAIMVSLDWRMSLLAFAAVPPVAIGVNWTRRRIRDAFREVRAKTARMNAYLNEQVSGMAVVQAYAREERSAEEFDEINSAYRSANNRSIVLDATLDAAIEMVSSVCIAAVLWYAGVKSLSEHISFGTLFAFVAYIDMFFVPIRDLSARYTLLQSAMAGAERIFELLDNKDEDATAVAATASGAGEAKPADEGVAFELDKVEFGYKPGVSVLREVSIAARSGEKVALVGATGAGKSTVASLLLRLYDVEEGVVRVFGRDVRAYPRDELRRKFAVVPQDVFLFPGTVLSNIAAGDATPDREKVVSALQRIGALDLFERREGGLDAPVLERGSNFSAGERQLIAFARALYRDPPILILDEATANVDSDTEARLQRALEGAMAGRTALIIAHRLSTIRAVDRIVVFHKGCVVEQGTHEALLAANGVYSKLYRLQFARQAAAAQA
ncbi:xenobiotic ABC transporter ATP-binding protein [Sorangium cellulosum]|jgi:ATP-binding cassette subfamily B protein|uniref:Xenobiotic ABC transporter ATP-binding protein n=1 Tax=Sorangium cellulosum TaxID=56 RepID=A0A4P2PSN4_SORCE|nr:ABC transporter ATP-binding protein [Sorangium cellulosum]AUX19567.1 xenobiotic ABC transporter ATP-binding protein [Sorangium cellulosum]